MKQIFIFISTFILAFFLFSCEKKKFCDVYDPLTELPWLKTMVDGYIKMDEAGFYTPVEIYRCRYKNSKTGFLIDPCVQCPDGMMEFYNCEGVGLCYIGGHTGKDECAELGIKLKNKKLIWKK